MGCVFDIWCFCSQPQVDTSRTAAFALPLWIHLLTPEVPTISHWFFSLSNTLPIKSPRIFFVFICTKQAYVFIFFCSLIFCLIVSPCFGPRCHFQSWKWQPNHCVLRPVLIQLDWFRLLKMFNCFSKRLHLFLEMWRNVFDNRKTLTWMTGTYTDNTMCLQSLMLNWETWGTQQG